jgi:hypothetical protein
MSWKQEQQEMIINREPRITSISNLCENENIPQSQLELPIQFPQAQAQEQYWEQGCYIERKLILVHIIGVHYLRPGQRRARSKRKKKKKEEKKGRLPNHFPSAFVFGGHSPGRNLPKRTVCCLFVC